MDEADLKLSTCLQKLELEGPKQQRKEAHGNPFRRRSKSLSSITNPGAPVCHCHHSKGNVKKTTSFKRNTRKIIQDPVLNIVKFKGHHRKTKENDKLFGQCSRSREKDFKKLVNACKQLTLDGCSLPRRQSPVDGLRSLASADLSGVASCSHQARLNVNPPCDVTIDELASYFETSVHIPKKMSSMAEMIGLGEMADKNTLVLYKDIY
ncbi:hypothetical protein HUJ04_008637 [Dendroctonus ponderosae]|nr:hypothetical protein HUJ04_008637 [Dendroctonus ponderosae]